MELPDREICYRALQSRDLRFDRLFFVGVTSTGIYGRPVSPACTAKFENCRFFLARRQRRKKRVFVRVCAVDQTLLRNCSLGPELRTQSPAHWLSLPMVPWMATGLA